MKNRVKTFLEILSFGIIGGASSLLPPRIAEHMPIPTFDKPKRLKANSHQSDDDYDADRDKEQLPGSLKFMRRNIIPMSGSVVSRSWASASGPIVIHSTPGGHRLYKFC